MKNKCITGLNAKCTDYYLQRIDVLLNDDSIYTADKLVAAVKGA